MSQTTAVFERDLAHWERHGFGQWWWRSDDGDELLARGGLQWTMVGGEASIEVGWAVDPEHWNRGLATELAQASLEVGFEQLGLDAIVAYTLVTNAASRRVMDKAGLVYERPVRHLDLPHVLYRLSRGEWRVLARRARDSSLLGRASGEHHVDDERQIEGEPDPDRIAAEAAVTPEGHQRDHAAGEPE